MATQTGTIIASAASATVNLPLGKDACSIAITNQSPGMTGALITSLEMSQSGTTVTVTIDDQGTTFVEDIEFSITYADTGQCGGDPHICTFDGKNYTL